MADISGTTGSKPITGTSGNDRIYTLETTGEVRGGDGDDQINGTITETGSYSRDSSLGIKTIYGEGGNDTIIGGDGNDTLDGGTGNDRILSGGGNDVISSGDGDDQINGFVSANGTVSFYSFSGSLNVTGGAGNDVIYGASGNDKIDGGSGIDDLSGLDGNDTLEGGAGADKLYGDAGDDKLFGGADDDTLTGGAGNDYLWGGNGDDTLDGGDGNDTLVADNGRDKLRGGAGNDNLFVASGSSGTALMFGDAGDDTLQGGNGADTLDGGAGADKLYGGAGDDKYVVDNLSDYVQDSQGSNTGLVTIDFYKQSTGFTWELGDGVKALPYWIDALVGDGTKYIDAQKSLTAGVIKYGFPNATLSSWNDQDKLGFTPLNEAQKAFVQKCLSYIETIINVRFEKVSDATEAGVLTFANNQQIGSAGYATGGLSFQKWGVFLNNTGTSASGNAAPGDGQYAAKTIMHEIGHALGLKHPHDGVIDNGAGGSTASDPPYLSAQEDVTTYTQMSYTSKVEDYVSQFRDLDIASLQYLYGPAKIAGTTKNQTGDTVYTLLTTQRNFIWDGGGIDTLDASAANLGLVLSLEVGGHSYFGTTPNQFITASGQITINIGTVIEKAYGTAYNDVITGNAEANYIRGNAGNDSLSGAGGNDQLAGGLGDDILDGGDGSDVAYYVGEGFATGIIVDLQSGTVSGGAGIDKLISIELVWGTEKADTFYGTAGADFFIGDDGNDYVDGRGGTDRYQINNDFSACAISFVGNTCVIATKDLGTDRLDNIENVTFVGTSTVSKTLEELRASTSINRAPTFSGLTGAAQEWVYDGHYYGLFTTNKTFDAAVSAAHNLGGYLLQISSTAEQSDAYGRVSGFLSGQLASTRAPDGGGAAYVWLGASDAASEGSWIWLADSSLLYASYTRWGSGALGSEPDNAGNQDALGLGLENWPAGSASGAGFGSAGFWNDISVNNSLYYVVEKSASLNISTNEDTAKAITLAASDADNDALTYTAAAAANGTVSVSGAVATYTPKLNYNGTDSFVVTASDGKGGSATQTIILTIAAVNDAPTFSAVSQAVSATAGTAKSITLAATDVDVGDTLTYTVATPGKGTAAILGSTLTYTPTSSATGTDAFVVTASDGKGGTATQTINATIATTSAPAVSAFNVIATNGWSGAISGNGKINGTGGYQDVRILSGSITLDGSFNDGGDIVRLAGNASDYTIMRSGSSAIFSKGTSISAVVPIGTVGAAVVFDNGVRKMIYDGTTFTIGGQAFSATASTITSASDNTTLPTGASSSASASIVLSGASLAAGQIAHLGVSGNAKIVGTSINDVVQVLSNIKDNLIFDPSFNQGGDIIILDMDGSSFSAQRSGSSMVLTATNEILTIPIGTVGLTLRFTDGDRTLIYTGTDFKIGTQAIGTTVTQLIGSKIVASLDVGTAASPVTLNAGTGAYSYTDNAAVGTEVKITNFGSDDKITVSGATSSQYSFTTVGTDLSITFNNISASVVNNITLVNAVSANDFVNSYASAQVAMNNTSFLVFG